jgi:hypothetical protein
MLNDFKAFIMKGNVVDMAVGIIIVIAVLVDQARMGITRKGSKADHVLGRITN